MKIEEHEPHKKDGCSEREGTRTPQIDGCSEREGTRTPQKDGCSERESSSDSSVELLL